MSVVREGGKKVILPRTGPDEFWALVHAHYARSNRRRWKYLAMLALRENAGWPMPRIAMMFGHSAGHVTRCLEKVKREMRERFDVSPDLLGMDE